MLDSKDIYFLKYTSNFMSVSLNTVLRIKFSTHLDISYQLYIVTATAAAVTSTSPICYTEDHDDDDDE
jgi:hypothetical protein